MICWLLWERTPFANLPNALHERAGREFIANSKFFGVDIQAFEGERFDVEIRRGIPEFLRWCAEYGCVRCDVNRASDLYLVLGKNPLTLQCIQAWQSQRGENFITSMQPDEVVTNINEFAHACMDASNTEIDRLRDDVRTGQFGAREILADAEHHAVEVLRAHGFKVPEGDDSDPLGPPAPREPQPLTGDWEGWDAEQFVGDTPPQGWEGF